MKMKILEIDVKDKTSTQLDVPEKYKYLGGRGLTSTVVSAEVDPACHPLNEKNMLVIAPGLFAGSVLSSANRLSAGAKSPLTGGIKEANSGGLAAYRLGRLGIKAIKIKGKGKGEFESAGIKISSSGVSFEDLSFIKGMTTYEAAKRLLERYGNKCAFLVIGPAGEIRLPTACINVGDTEGEPCRNLGRGGLGAVMGSKGIKAIIIDDQGLKSPWKENDKVKQVIKKFARALKEHPVTGEKFAKYGTVMTLLNVNSLGGLPTRNFTQGTFEDAEKIGAESLREKIANRGGMTAHSCMPGCVIQCSNKYVKKNGSPLVGSLDFETVCLLGANIGISDLDQIATLNRLCNDYGVDTMETGVTLGVMAEAGIFEYGNYKKIKGIVDGLGTGTPIGRILGSGAAVAGKVFGVERVPVVKDQGMAAYDPRAIKGMGITYSMSPMGAEHTAGNAITLAVDHLDPEAQIKPVRELHINTMVLDTLGICIFTGRVTLGNTDIVEDIIEAFFDHRITFEELQKIAEENLKCEREFNRRAGISADRLPQFMLEEQLPPNNTVYDIDMKELESFYD